MQNLILVVHIFACVIMTGLVLIQKSEGGGLGMGGGGGGNSLMSGRGAAGALVRTTIIVGGVFFITSLALTSIANRDNDTRSDVEKALGADDTGASGGPTDLFDPSSTLLDGQDGGAGSLSTPEAPTDDLVDPTASEPAAPLGDPAAEETPVPTEPETGNPQ
ncbi:MAG: preprotein translocase subunit SecG [Alphaproteobacteria bacterium]|nr:preprotein translocase subunit SecG [Alphaproteobacteria bacterium]MBU2085375.1 preprotein translocase subunit SecG [Alphaproteobacteria bacterium]MBU2141886.1 preprotein translocase subunit SecG [Alphaproteobacteria bacterium]MBU2195742.1 preprotein translocase subunit SecG [Alphaproteobacteria bacterium]